MAHGPIPSARRLSLSGLLLFMLAALYSGAQAVSSEKRVTSPADVKMLTLLANTGRAEAQYRLAKLYLAGQGVETNRQTAMSWLTRSAEQNYAPAQNQLGLIFLGSLGDAIDCQQAYNWFARIDSRSRLYAQAQSNLAWIMATCPDAEIRDGARALAIVKPLVDDSHPPSASLLDTLAAAYAEIGEFNRATEVQQRAIDALKQTPASDPQMQRFVDRLQHYRHQQPWRLH